MSHTRRGYIFLFIAMFLWGIHGPAGHFLATRGVDMLWVASARVLMGTVIFGVFLLITGKFTMDWRERWRTVAALSFVGLFLNTVTFHLALNTISGTLVMIIENLSPVFVFFLSFALAGVRPTWREIIALILSLLGMLLIVYGKDSFDFGGGDVTVGIIWAVGAGITFGWYVYFSADLVVPLRDDPVKVVQFLFKIFVISTVLMLPFLFRDCPKPQKADEWFWLVEMGLFQSGGAYLCWNYALRDVPVNTASVLFLLTILFTAINELLFLNLALNAYIVIGGILIIASGRLITRNG
ncbi:MAG TPA: DMT family transporter [bacterium]|nr:DMT family transporter [bacterium]